jgi:hypothetical protein
MYSSYSFMTSALDGGEWSASRPGRALVPGKGPPVHIVQEAGWAPEPVWKQRIQEKSFRLCQGFIHCTGKIVFIYLLILFMYLFIYGKFNGAVNSFD